MYTIDSNTIYYIVTVVGIIISSGTGWLVYDIYRFKHKK